MRATKARTVVSPQEMAALIKKEVSLAGASTNVWEKHGQFRIYVVRARIKYGYIRLDRGFDSSNLEPSFKQIIEPQVQRWATEYLVRRPSAALPAVIQK